MKVNLKEIEVGDIFSEESHYVVEKVKMTVCPSNTLKVVIL